MTLFQFKDYLNDLFFSSGIYPDDCKFQVLFHKDLAFIAILGSSVSGDEPLLLEDIVFGLTKRNTYVISSINIRTNIDSIKMGREVKSIIDKYLSQEEFENHE